MRYLEGGEYITPNISLIDDGKRVYSEKKVNIESNLITFTVGRVEYQAEEGMTWQEFVNSEYNTDGFYTNSFGVYMSVGVQIYKDSSLSTIIEPSDAIINGHSYTVASPGSGD